MDYIKQKGYIGCMDHMDCMVDYIDYIHDLQSLLKSQPPVFETCYHFY